MLLEAREAQATGDLARASALLESVVAMDPADAYAWAKLGTVELDREQFASGMEALERAIELRPDYAGAYSQLAQCYVDLDKLPEAEATFRTSIRLHATAARYVMLGDVLEKRGSVVEAEAAYRSALDLDPEDAEAMLNLAVLVRAHHRDEALSLLDGAIAADPAYAPAYRERGSMRAADQRYADAESDLRTAVHLDPGEPWAAIYLGHVLWATDRLQEAEEVFRQVSRSMPGWELPHKLLGDVFEKLDRYEEAESEYRLAVDLDPSDSDSAYQLGRHLILAGCHAEAL